MRSLLLALATTVSALIGTARAENAVIAAAIAGFVKPSYEAFHSISAQLRVEMEELCADQSPNKLAAVQSTFLTVVTAWSEVEIIRFGPVTEENRLERILFWPDRKGIGLRQVQAALAGKDASAIHRATLKEKSVAMQGLGALEYVLFGTGSEALAEPGDPYRCAYGLAVARNIEDMSTKILAGWQDPAGIAKQWANPGAENSLYRTDNEALVELFDIFVYGVEMVRDVRINGFLGATAAADKPKLAVFWRSNATTASILANVRGMKELFDAAGFAKLLPADSKWIAESIDFEFADAERALGNGGGPLAEMLADERKRGDLVYFRIVTSSLSELFGVRLAAALGITAGFSSLDGD